MLSFLLALAVDPRGLFAAYDRPDAAGVSVLVRHDGQTLFRRSYGLAEVENKRAATSQTNYRLASISKQFTATTVLTLVQENGSNWMTRLRLTCQGYPPALPYGTYSPISRAWPTTKITCRPASFR